MVECQAHVDPSMETHLDILQNEGDGGRGMTLSVVDTFMIEEKFVVANKEVQVSHSQLADKGKKVGDQSFSRDVEVDWHQVHIRLKGYL